MFARRSIQLSLGTGKRLHRARVMTRMSKSTTAVMNKVSSQHVVPQEFTGGGEMANKVAMHKKTVAELLASPTTNLHTNTDVNDDKLIPKAVIQAHIDAGATASFLVTNMDSIRSMHTLWMTELPMVKPFYAVKCNPDPSIVRLLASLGCGFDCATQGEIDLVCNGLGDELSFSPEKAASSIIYAHPAKMKHMLRFALDQNVGMTVFDGEDELHKIASMEGFKDIQVLLRLTTDDKSSICRFSKKFGCPVGEATHLLEVAKSLGVNVVGCSFHVGSGCGDAQAYTTALDHCRQVFISAEKLGMQPMSVIDIGGGFPGDTGGYGGEGMPTFQELASEIRGGIASFCEGGWTTRSVKDFRFMAEPGRYFVSASTSIASRVYSRKGGQSNDHQALYLDDGVYGSFNSVVYDHATPVPYRVVPKGSAEYTTDAVDGDIAVPVLMPTAVFGPTCDGLDQICSVDTTLMPRVNVDDWLVFDNCGAYTHTASFFFNGYTHIPSKLYCN